MRQRYNNFDTGLQTITIAASSHGWVSGFRHIAKDKKISSKFRLKKKIKFLTAFLFRIKKNIPHNQFVLFAI